jgi:hypothetical protein
MLLSGTFNEDSIELLDYSIAIAIRTLKNFKNILRHIELTTSHFSLGVAVSSDFSLQSMLFDPKSYVDFS